jgi:hypothetical protein
MVRVGKGLYAPSAGADLRGLTGRSVFPRVYTMAGEDAGD